MIGSVLALVLLGAAAGFSEVGSTSADTNTSPSSVENPSDDRLEPTRPVGTVVVANKQRPEGGTSASTSLGAESGSYQLGGVWVRVDSISYLDSSGLHGDGTRIAVDLTVGNDGMAVGLTPSADLVCMGVADTGNYYVDSTITSAREVPAGTVSSGTIVLGLPRSLGSQACRAPVVRVTATVPLDQLRANDGLPHVDVPVPAGVFRY